MNRYEEFNNWMPVEDHFSDSWGDYASVKAGEALSQFTQEDWDQLISKLPSQPYEWIKGFLYCIEYGDYQNALKSVLTILEQEATTFLPVCMEYLQDLVRCAPLAELIDRPLAIRIKNLIPFTYGRDIKEVLEQIIQQGLLLSRNTIVDEPTRKRILYGEIRNGRLVGGHSSEILDNQNYRVDLLDIYYGETLKIRLEKYDGITNKWCTNKCYGTILFPTSWTDDIIIESIIKAGNALELITRVNWDGTITTIHQEIIEAGGEKVQIVVIKEGDHVIGAYPTSGSSRFVTLPEHFSPQHDQITLYQAFYNCIPSVEFLFDDYWFDYGSIYAEKLLSQFTGNDWEALKQGMISDPESYMLKRAFLTSVPIDSVHALEGVISILEGGTTKSGEMETLCIEQIECLLDHKEYIGFISESLVKRSKELLLKFTHTKE